ncbi:copper amine oxidase N-terminal domain-containing protein [Clostridium sp. 'deep sea']|uniref:copper amine oxidase N-terminal domain-containing protein n=1 Tax=Clostridium sp. 'deep sea' TaxID=2779445 RepID=UPI0018969479|nr:copper amine oxidase N-terminal domain-containing protein [Clostridium sp. 'deep sea']QOR34251.1 copper amine oxidase N-terminal domain-containing protein [Clostridium sp. 'deep sea']
MKRILSITAIVALIVSMFSGVALAEGNAKVVLDRKVVELNGNSGGNVIISGRVVSNYSTVNASGYAYIQDSGANIIGYKVPFTNGRFDIKIFESMLTAGTYTVKFDSCTEYSWINGDEDEFRVIPQIEFSEGSLNMNFPVPTQPIIRGYFPNQDGDKYILKIGYIQTGTDNMQTHIATAISNGKTFGFLMDSTYMSHTGEIGIFAYPKDGGAGVLMMKGNLAPADLPVNLITKRVPHSLNNQPIVIDLNLPDKYISGSKMESPYTITAQAYDKDSNRKHENISVVGNGSTNNKFIDKNKQTASFELFCNDWGKSDVNLIIELRENSKVIMASTFELKIVNPDTYTLMGWGLDEVSVGDIVLGFPSMLSGTFPGDTNIVQNIEIKKYESGTTPKVCKYVEVRAEGCGVDKILRNYGDNPTVKNNVGIITPTKTGKMDFTIKVYSDENDKSPNETFKKTINITGYNITFNRDAIEVDTTADFIVTVRDENDDPVNNAIIKLGTKTIVSGSTANISNGTYIYKDDEKNLFSEVGQLTLNVSGYHHGNWIDVSFNDAIDVTGKEVYSLNSKTNILVNGAQEEVYVSTIDQSGDVIFPRFERIDIDAEGNKSTPISITSGAYKDFDNDGEKESARLNILPNFNQAKMIIRAVTDGGKKMGQITFNVQPPKVVMEKTSSATENIKAQFKFKIIDPRNNSVLDKEVYFQTDDKYVDFSLKDEDNDYINISDGKSSAEEPNSDEEYIYTLLVDDVDWDKAEDKEYIPTIGLYIENGATDIKMLDIPVKKPELKCNPSEIVVGTVAAVTITYVDGDGNPLEGYEVKVNDEDLGETDEMGRVFFNAASVGGVSHIFKAKTDDFNDENSDIIDPSDKNKDTILTEAKLKSVIDMKGPEVTAPAKTNKSSAMIIIEDNVRVELAYVYTTAGVEKVDIKIPMGRAYHPVKLKQGVNKFTVEAMDINKQFSTTDITIVYDPSYDPNAGTTPTPNPDPTTPDPDPTTPDPTPTPTPSASVTFTIGESTEYGVPVLKNSVTMVPVRFAQALGASFDWDGTTRTVTYSLGDKVVKVTVGKSFAVVNGVNVLMDAPAYLNSQQRTMVPVRMIARELGFNTEWKGNDKPIKIFKK